MYFALMLLAAALPVVASRSNPRLDALKAKVNAEVGAVVERQAAQIRKHAANLAGEDQTAVKEALRYFTELKEPKMVALGLEYPAANVKIEAARCLQVIGGREVVPQMLAALEAANQPLMRGGAEGLSWKRDVKRALLNGLAKITQLDVMNTDADSEEAVNNAIRRVQEWLRAQDKI